MDSNIQAKAPLDSDVDSLFGKSKPVVWRTVMFVVLIVATLGAAITFVIYFVAANQHNSNKNGPSHVKNPVCNDQCVLSLVESIPVGLTFKPDSPSHPSTFSGLMSLMEAATKSIEIASFYWTLNGSDIDFHDNSSWEGEKILQTLASAGHDRKIKIKIAQNEPDGINKNTEYLAKYAGAEVRTLNFKQWFNSGILHTKMWLIDRKHLYVGSANLDWRSLTQVKELGAVVYNCSCMAVDMGKIFDVYWYLGAPNASIPNSWPAQFSTSVNDNTSMLIKFNNSEATTYLSSSPSPLCPEGRTIDIDAIIRIIDSAEEFVYVAVMDYFPTTQFPAHGVPRRFWPVIDDAFKRAAFDRGVNVSLLISHWNHTWEDMPKYLKSLAELKSYWEPKIDINVRIFQVPAFTEDQRKIPYARVNHNKYMVTDKTAYIGTSNWSADYFIDTGGIGLVVNQNKSQADVRQQLEDIFLRDWHSNYSTYIWDFNFTRPHHHFHVHTEL
ncbi:5'-3' exonuclease PLD3-like [Saccostrea echinata]|uniref:5'-3' exonuclease PLD3-like n=1 Tax=Saccostrea echinata TaxID=191078 RepID=UPI002A83659B|nr:5'-3' exonuclease PLD3-like [Saccostrea echinata]